MPDYLKLVSARVTNFACFEDTGDVPIDPQVTVLLAENENGKSSFLRAIGWFSEADVAFAEDDRWDQAARDKTLDIVALTFEMNTTASTALKERCAIKAPKNVRVVRRTDGSYRVEDAATGDELRSAAGSAFKFARAELVQWVANFETSADLSGEREELAGLVANAVSEDDREPISAVASYIREHLTPHLDERLVGEAEDLTAKFEDPSDPLLPTLDEFLPTTIYFGEDVEELNDSVAYEDAASSPQDHRTMINLAALVGEDLVAMASREAHDRQGRSRKASTTVSGGVAKYWAEGGLRIYISFDETQMVVTVLHKERDQKPSRRSRGLRWFLGFYVNFSARTNEDLEGAILLLDEPGIFLHLKQQTKILELLDNLARSNQIVYSTQLPKMVPVAKLHRIRLLVADDNETHKVRVEANVRAIGTSEDVTQPIRAALGMGIADSISLGNVNLVVEGWIDPYLLDSMSLYCRNEGRTYLDQEVTLHAAGSAGKKMLPAVSRVVGAGTAKGVVVLDDDATGHEAEKAIRKVFGDLVPIIRVLDEGSKPTEKEIEDLLSRGYYLDLTNASYQGRVENYEAITHADLGDGPIVNAIDALFKKRKYGSFQKIYPARELQVRLQTGGDPPDMETLDNFAALFDRINTALASFDVDEAEKEPT